jgi:hypothetical protein
MIRQSIEQAQRDCRHDEQIHRGDAVGMVAEERPPAWGRRVSSPDHVLGHARLSDLDAELEELSLDPRRSPQRIGNAHLADQLAYLQRHRRPATPRFRLPLPISTEAGAMPFDHGLRLNYCQRIANAREKPIKANKNQAVDGAEGLFLSGSPQNVSLPPQHPNFSLERCPRPKQIADHPNHEPDKISHPARASPDSRSTASQIEFAMGTTSVAGVIAPNIEQAEIERANQKAADRLDSYDHYLRAVRSRWSRLDRQGQAEKTTLSDIFKRVLGKWW